MVLVGYKLITSNQTEIVFSNIPQDGTDLLLLLSMRSDRATQNDYAGIKINGSVANLSEKKLWGNGSTTASDSSTNLLYGVATAATSLANTFGNSSLYFSNYRSAFPKAISVDAVSETNATAAFMFISAAAWNSSNPITSLTIYPAAGGTNWVFGSSALLYKITKGSDSRAIVT